MLITSLFLISVILQSTGCPYLRNVEQKLDLQYPCHSENKGKSVIIIVEFAV